MNIFEKRPLCLILCIGLCGFFLFSLEINIIRAFLIIFSVLLGFIFTFLRIDKRKKLIGLLCAAAVLLSSLLSFLYFDLYFKAYQRYDDVVEITGVVEEVSEASSYTTRLLVRGERLNGRLTTYRFYAYANKSDTKGIIDGTRISFRARLEGFSSESFSNNISKGINAYASDLEDISIVEYTNGGLQGGIKTVREYLARYIISISSKDTGAILSALLLGERDYLPDQLRLDFKRIGISHILALSGMHLAILSLGINAALKVFNVKKKIRLATISIFVLLYMAVTGFSLSVVRAGLMLIISSLLFLFSRPKDSLTSLTVAVCIILLISPHAIFSISLQLSALATFGIIIMSEVTAKLKKPTSKKDKLLRYLGISFLASVFAISSTMLVSAHTFKGISLLGPLTTLIFSLLAEIIMYLGCIMVLIGWLIPIGWIITPLCLLMSWIAGMFSSIKFAYASVNYSIILISVIVYSIIFYLFAIVKLKNPLRALNVIVALFLVLNLLPFSFSQFENRKEVVAYYSDDKCDEILLKSKNQVCLINSAQYSKNLAYTTLEFLEQTKTTYINKYYLTHYSWSIDDELEILLYNVSVEEIYLPTPRNEDENTILKLINKSISDSRTSIVLFEEDQIVENGNYSISLLYSVPYGETSMNAVGITDGNKSYTYISSGLLDGKTEEIFIPLISNSDCLILGEHGKSYKDKVFISQNPTRLKSLIMHSKNLFLTQDSMSYLLEKECDIYSHPMEIIYLK